MTSRIVREGEGHQYPGQLREITISCDHISCDAAVNDARIRESGGLLEMGWETAPTDGTMRHYCPKHNRSKRSED